MTKSPPTLVVDSIMLGPALMLINQYLSAPVPEQFLLWLVMVSLSVCLFVSLSKIVTASTFNPGIFETIILMI